MSRGRANSRESGWESLGQQLKNEILSAVQLLLRNARQQSIPLLDSDVLWTSYQFSLSPKEVCIPFKLNTAEVSPDVVSRLKKMGVSHSLALLTADSAKIQRDKSIQPQDVTIKTLSLFQPDLHKNYSIELSKIEPKIILEKQTTLS